MGLTVINTRRIVLIILAISGCTKEPSFEHKLENRLNETCSFSDSSICIVNFEEFLNISFDEIYLFNGLSTRGTISEIIGFPYSGSRVANNDKRVLFVKENHIVLEEDYERIFCFFYNGQIPKRGNQYEQANCEVFYSPLFKVKKVYNENGIQKKYFYNLINIHNELK